MRSSPPSALRQRLREGPDRRRKAVRLIVRDAVAGAVDRLDPDAGIQRLQLTSRFE